MDDSELIRRAGLAAGVEYSAEANPLIDDALALRLAVKLRLTVGPHLGATHAGVAPCPDDFEDGKFPVGIAQMHNDDPLAATRRAITRAAAAIGGYRG